MIPNFNAYNLINESITLQELSKGNEKNYSYYDMKRGFLSKGYEFLGNISLKVLTYNCFSYDEIIDVVPDELINKLRECGPRKYISTVPEKKYINTNTFGRDYNLDGALKIISEPNIESVRSCFSKKGDLYYVLWNNKKRYLYHSIIKKEITIGRGEECDLSFPSYKNISKVQSTIYFDVIKRQWMIRDGYDDMSSEKGTWIFSINPILVYNGMVINLWDNFIQCKFDV